MIYLVLKLTSSPTQNSPIAGLTMPPLNGQLMQSGINSMLSVSPDMLSPRFIQVINCLF